MEDGSELRRGHPVAHAIFGVPDVINSANYVYFIALERTLALNHPKVPHHNYSMLLRSSFEVTITISWTLTRALKCLRNSFWNFIGVKGWRYTGGTPLLAPRKSSI